MLEKTENTLGWSRQTVKTYLDRLNEKGLVSIKKISPKVHLYYSSVSKEEYATPVAGLYLKKYFNKLPEMMAGLIKTEDITDDELDNLEQIIKEYGNKR